MAETTLGQIARLLGKQLDAAFRERGIRRIQYAQ